MLAAALRYPIALSKTPDAMAQRHVPFSGQGQAQKAVS
jgi:hypothetical protein